VAEVGVVPRADIDTMGRSSVLAVRASPHIYSGRQIERFDDPRIWKFGLVIQPPHILDAARFK
jgi:hypothetical protein